MRTLLLTGPGGAGTSTLAAAAAVRSARAGRRTLLLTRQAARVPGLDDVEGLDVLRVDAQASFERLWGGTAGAVGAVVPHLTLPPDSSVVPIPGTADLALFAELARAEADLVVLDAGPLEAMAALVSLPSSLRWWLDQAMPPGMRALGAVRTAAVAAGAAKRGPVDAALAAVPVVEKLLNSDRLADPTTVCLVAEPRRANVASLRGAVTTLALHGLATGAVLSRVLPLGDQGEWSARRAAEQDAVLRELAEVAPLHRIAEHAVGPEDVDGLAGLLDGFELPAAAAPEAPAAERHDGAWQLTVPLPFAERSAVRLTRWVDDLVVSVGDARRSIRLDALLRRCEVTGGRLVDPGTPLARLVVGFRPDPQLWPADLLAAEERTS
ncbi:ArsA-related P-loop ATPase [Blastococcus sp. CT_GayMR16]|uniref:ArsA family ATPase n=1 Tax=Blastococcus sp. CT_GayMR16 TaxID=2559607 RepID=UPI0010732D04|nr:ArsA-related P-loop ATPase [Blastococcus sp. CT_GayMR16]TFV89441.1 ion transporter [Blastococcus sp. CT_GayMR16]